MKLAESLFIVAIPDVDKTVRSTRNEGVVNWMETQSIDREDFLQSIFFDAVTFEGVFFLLNFGAAIKKFYGDSPLNAAQHKT